MYIKKIIVSLDNQDIKRIIIVYDNKIEWYTNIKYSKEQLKIIYSNMINLLIRENKFMLNGTKQDMINQLSGMKKIERNESLLISSINMDNKKYIVNYNMGEYTEEVSNDDFNKILEKLSKDYLINVNELNVDKLEKIGLLKRNDLNREIKNKKIKRLLFNKRTISMLLALGITGGVFAGFKINSSMKKEKKEENFIVWLNDEIDEPDITPYEENSLTIKPNITPYEEVEEKSIIIEPDIISSKEITNNNITIEPIFNVLKELNNYMVNLNSLKDVSKKVYYTYLSYLNNNFLDDIKESSNLTTTNINGNTYKIIETKNGYNSIIKKIGIQNSEGCYDYSLLYTNAIIENSKCSYSFDSGLTDNVISTENEQRLLQIVAKELLEGRTSIIRVNGVYKGNGYYSRHFVVVVGINENYDLNNLKQSDFLIADPASAGLKILNTEYGGKKRFLLQTKDDYNWGSNNINSSGYVVIVADDIKKYIAIDLQKGIVPWVTYIPEDTKII